MSTVEFPQAQRLVATPGGVTGTGTVSFPVPDPSPGRSHGGAWQLAAVTFRVVTSATVQTRTPLLTILGPDNAAMVVAAAGYGITASSTADYSYVLGLSEWDQANNAAASGPVPSLMLDPGDTIQLSLSNADTTDAISRVHIALQPREW